MELSQIKEDGQKKIKAAMYLAECEDLQYESIVKELDQHTANTWKIAMETILECGLLDELEVPSPEENEIRHAEFNALNRKVTFIRAYINDKIL